MKFSTKNKKIKRRKDKWKKLSDGLVRIFSFNSTNVWNSFVYVNESMKGEWGVLRIQTIVMTEVCQSSSFYFVLFLLHSIYFHSCHCFFIIHSLYSLYYTQCIKHEIIIIKLLLYVILWTLLPMYLLQK